MSKFLPDNFDSNSIVVMLAGRGEYPIIVAKKALEEKINLRLIAIEDESEQELIDLFSEEHRCDVKVGQLGKALKLAKNFGARHMIFSGQIPPKRLFKGLHPDLKAFLILASLKKRNAETIFGALAEEFAKIGAPCLDARVFLDEHLASEGMMTSGSIKPAEQEYISHGIEVAKEIARLDVGQGLVVRKGTVLAVEGFDGTDKMLRRCADFETKGKIFIKTVKPRQDYRFDVPAFGMRTLESLQIGGIDTVALEANSTVIVNKPKVLAEANRLGIRIYGYLS